MEALTFSNIGDVPLYFSYQAFTSVLYFSSNSCKFILAFGSLTKCFEISSHS